MSLMDHKRMKELKSCSKERVLRSWIHPSRDDATIRTSFDHLHIPHIVPHPMRAPRGHPSMQNNGSYGGYPPPPPPHRRGDHPPSHRPPPNQVPYTQSGSFDENYPGPAHHYSPQVYYPTPGRGYQADDVNVISPNHKPDPYRPPMTPRSRQHVAASQYYQYPPTSPVSRPAGSQSNFSSKRQTLYKERSTNGGPVRCCTARS